MKEVKFVNSKHFSQSLLQSIGDVLLREEDKRELEAATGKSAGQALVDAINFPDTKAWMCVDRSFFPIAFFGYTRLRTQEGRAIWMVATPDIYDHIKIFLQYSTAILDYWLRKYGALHGYIDTRNGAHVKWLRRLHFEFPEGKIAIFNGVRFQYFKKEK